MSDKEPVDGQKANMYSLSSKPASKQLDEARDSGESNPMSGYYQNVAQKGKLILPTALWVLLVIAGVCFLTLLASLNKTISTLDTLVELEQEQANHHNKEYEHRLSASSLPSRYHHGHHHQHSGQEQHLEPPRAEELPFKADLSFLEEPSGMFSFPSWTSLEPSRSESSLFKKLLGGQSGVGQMIPVGASVVISSSEPQAGSDNANLIDSIMEQLSGTFNGLGRGEREQMMSAEERPEKSSTLITANIDKINVNINAPPEKKTKRPKKTPAAPVAVERPNKDEDDIKQLGDSIDSLMQKLMDPVQGLRGEQSPLSEGILMPVGPQPLADGLVRPQLSGHHMHHFHGHRPAPMSPLANLLMPVPTEERPTPTALPLSPADFNAGPFFFSLDNGQIIDPPPFEHKLKARPDEHRQVNSPYEFVVADQPNPMMHKLRPPTNMPPNGVAMSLIDSIMRDSMQRPPQRFDKPEPPIIIFDDSHPNAKPQPDEQTRKDNAATSNSAEDLFKMFFGPPPNADLVVLQAKPNADQDIQAAKSEPEKSGQAAGSQPTRLEESSVELAKEEAPKQQAKTDNPASRPSSSSGDDNMVSLNDVFSAVFSAPQFGNRQMSIKVDPTQSSELNKAGQKPPTVGTSRASPGMANSTTSNSGAGGGGSSSAGTKTTPSGGLGSAGSSSNSSDRTSSGSGQPSKGSSGSSGSSGGSDGSGGSGNGRGGSNSSGGSDRSGGGSHDKPASVGASSSSGGSSAAPGPKRGSEEAGSSKRPSESSGSSGTNSHSSSRSSTPSSSSQSASKPNSTTVSSLMPVAFVPVSGNNPPKAIGAYLTDEELSQVPAYQSKPEANSTPSVASPSPTRDERPRFGQPGSILSALNNSTGSIVSRILSRLNSTNMPCDKSI